MGKKQRALLIFLVAGLALPACAQQPAASGSSAAKTQAVPAGARAQKVIEDPNYVIGAQDVLDINVWKEPDISRTVPVRPDGKISLPLVNDVQAAGLTPLQLATQIATGLTKFMTNPQVTVIVNQINSQRIYVMGQVARVGAYLLIPGMTVLQAISNAGGFNTFANQKKIYVIREDGGKEQKLFFNYKQVIAGKNTEQNVVLRAGDTVFVP